MKTVLSILVLTACCHATPVPGILSKLNETAQALISDVTSSIDKGTSKISSTVSGIADTVNSATGQITTGAIDIYDKVGDGTKQTVDATRDAVQGMLNLTTNIPVIGKMSKYPIAGVEYSADVAKKAVDLTVGMGETVTAVGNAVSSEFVNKVSEVTTGIADTVKDVSSKGAGLVSKIVDKSVSKTQEDIGKITDWLHNLIS